MDQLTITREKLIQSQEEDSSLFKYLKKEGPLLRKGKETNYVKQKGVMHRFVKKFCSEKNKLKQILVPKIWRKKMMEVAHHTMLTEHMDVKKTKDRIPTNFDWPGIHQDVEIFCRLCDLCQRKVSKSSVAKIPLGKIPLMNLLFKRMCS